MEEDALKLTALTQIVNAMIAVKEHIDHCPYDVLKSLCENMLILAEAFEKVIECDY